MESGVAPSTATLPAARAVSSLIGLPASAASAWQRTPHHRGRCAHGDHRALADIAVHLEHHAGVRNGPVEALLLAILLIRGTRARSRLRYHDRRDQLIGLDDRELRGIGVRHEVQLADAQRPFAALRRSQLHARAQSQQPNRCRRRRNRWAGAVLHDGVVLVQPFKAKQRSLPWRMHWNSAER